MDPNILSVQANFNSSTGGESVPVKSIIIHPDYDGRAITSDIALLVLSAPIRIDEYAPLNPKEEDLLVGTSINITGWGGTGLQKGSTELQTLRTIVAPSTYCAHDYGNFYDSLHICAYFLKGGSTEKDAGGPVTDWDGVVVGLGSLGTDARPDGLGVYMRISPYINWIRSNGFAPNVTESYYRMRRKN
jgi:secreted trypsin-like serine protease